MKLSLFTDDKASCIKSPSMNTEKPKIVDEYATSRTEYKKIKTIKHKNTKYKVTFEDTHEKRAISEYTNKM